MVRLFFALRGAVGEKMTVFQLYFSLNVVVLVVLGLALLVRSEPVGRESLVRVSKAP
jgi:hypothetical protein